MSINHYIFNRFSLVEHGTHNYVGCGRFSSFHVQTNILKKYLLTSLFNLSFCSML